MGKKNVFKTGIASISLLSSMAVAAVLTHHGHVYAAESNTTANQQDALSKAQATVNENQQLVDEKTTEKQAKEAAVQADTQALADTNVALEEVEAQLENAATTVTTTDLASLASGVSGTFLAPGQQQQILDRLNAIRKEAYDLGYVSSYVPLKWSTELEKMAMTRAAEASQTNAHTRLNGQNYRTINEGKLVSDDAENLAWGSSVDVNAAIDMWYDEIKLYAQGVRDWNTVGHYRQMIDPSYTHTALGWFDATTPKTYRYMVAQAFTKDNKGTSESLLGTYGSTSQGATAATVDTAALNEKKSSLQEQQATLQASLAANKQALEAVTQELEAANQALQAAKATLADLESTSVTQPTEETPAPTEETPAPTEETPAPETPTTGTSETGISDEDVEKMTDEGTTYRTTPLEYEVMDNKASLPEAAVVTITVKGVSETAAKGLAVDVAIDGQYTTMTTDANGSVSFPAAPGTTVRYRLVNGIDGYEMPSEGSVTLKEGQNSATIQLTPVTHPTKEETGEILPPKQPEVAVNEEVEEETFAEEIQPEALPFQVSATAPEQETTEEKAAQQPESQTTQAPQTALEKAEAEGTLLPNTGVSADNYVVFGSAASAIIAGLGLTIPVLKKKQ